MSDRRTIDVGGRVFTVLFPDLVRPLTEEERSDLRESITRRGILTPPVVDENDGVIDGINRLEIMAEAGATRFADLVCPLDVRRGLGHDEKEAIALDLNSARRQMTRDEITAARSRAGKHDAVEAELKKNPHLSDGAIARKCGVHQSTVSRIRAKSTHATHESEERVGRDGRTINVGNIGKKTASDDPPPLHEDDGEDQPDELDAIEEACRRQHEEDRDDYFTSPAEEADDLDAQSSNDEATATAEDAAESRNDFVNEVNEVLTDDDGKAQRQEAREERSAARDARRVEALELAAATAPASQDWRIILGDCLDVLGDIDEVSVHLVFADPPYNIGWDYGDGKASDSIPTNTYLDWCEAWMAGIMQVLTMDGSFWLLVSSHHVAELKTRAEAVGFHLNQWLIWYEAFGQSRGSLEFAHCHRHLLWFVVSPEHHVFNADAVRTPSVRLQTGDSRADPRGRVWSSVWGIDQPIPRVAGTHAEAVPDSPAPVLPQALLRPIVACASDPGDLVLDPFAGNGTLGIAALALGRRFVGIEKRPEIHAIGERQIKAALAKLNTTQGE